MKVLFDGYWLSGGPPSGKAVVRDLIHAWIDQYPDDVVTVAVPQSYIATAQELFPKATLVGLRSRPHAIAVALELSLVAMRGAYDTVITQNFRAFGARSAVFIHDALFATHPQWFTFRERAYLALIPRLLGRRTTVFTSTSNEANRIRAHLHSGPVHPLGLAVPSQLSDVAPRRPDGLPDDIRPFLLTVGRLNVRKNLGQVIEAFLASDLLELGFRLVVVGERSGRQSEGAGSGMEPSVIYLGAIDDSQLRWLYENTKGLVCMSLDEGFGMPPMEALAFGAPIAVSDIAVFHELYEGCAHFADPLDVDCIRAAMQELVRSPTTTQALPFTWPQIVRRMREEILRHEAG